ncbi:MAG TPA: NYN domain-containing protein [Candidatus Pacearchaeota archaeon]|nr:NYN domain-containing protein [Candidatus Pacearchaeota archaeon]
MKVIIFNDIKNFDGCLNIINKNLGKGKKRFWDIDKYIPFLFEKIKALNKGRFNKEELKLVKTFIYSGRYNSKIMTGIKWSCNKKIKEIQDVIDREKFLLREISKHKLNKKISKKINDHVKNIINLFTLRKKFYVDRINKQIRNREGQREFFNKIDENPFIDLRTTLLKYGDGEIYQKGVDVKLATDLVNLAHTEAYDIALILGGDTDLVECVKLVRENRSKIVIVVAYYIEGDPLSSTISDLRKEADYFINLKDFNKQDIESMSEIRK